LGLVAPGILKLGVAQVPRQREVGWAGRVLQPPEEAGEDRVQLANGRVLPAGEAQVEREVVLHQTGDAGLLAGLGNDEIVGLFGCLRLCRDAEGAAELVERAIPVEALRKENRVPLELVADRVAESE